MKKLQAIFTSCLACALIVGCAPKDEDALKLDFPDVTLDVPANDGAAPVTDAADSGGGPPPPPPDPNERPEEEEDIPEGTVPREKIESLINASKAAEGDAGLIHVLQEAVEGYYRENRALPPDLRALVKSGHLEKFPITPKGKKVQINGKTLEVTIVESEEGADK